MIKLEEEFNMFANCVKHDILRRRMLEYFYDCEVLNPSGISPQQRVDEVYERLSLEQIEKLAQNAWLDIVDKVEEMI